MFNGHYHCQKKIMKLFAYNYLVGEGGGRIVKGVKLGILFPLSSRRANKIDAKSNGLPISKNISGFDAKTTS